MTYNEAVAWVHTLPRLAKKPGIENTRTLLQKLGNPQDSLKFVHVAGTNGKGSVTMMLASVLCAAGYKTGANISPYVLDFRERFLINGEMIAADTLADILTQVRNAAAGQESLVEFDAVTAAALLWFAREACDIVCLEVGLGGRLDSTNAVQNTIVACVAAIGMDHTELLGNTYAQIAAEKCGVFKNSCTVVCYPVQPQEALAEITQRAAAQHCPLIVPEAEDVHLYRAPAFENRINYGGYDLVVPLPGLHQAYNAAMVVEAALALCDNGFDISDEAIIDGIAAVRFPARIEVLSKNPLVILDGAHNPDGAKALADTLRVARAYRLIAIMGVLTEKQPEQMLSALCPHFASIYTVTPDSPRAMPAQELAALAKAHCADVTPCDSVADAVRRAKAQAAQMDTGLVICGSLYLAAQARKLFLA